ncbi:MAG TPA: VWA domain-containing protein [Pyrinomonadaceae bacterium]|nr:VWA domain-containing protein [Pyrinomonadaceae bacterium]
MVCGLVLSGLIFGSSVFASGDQDRPRSTQTPTATPTPPATTPAKPASTPVPSPTPQTQRPQTDRIAPTLGEPPPPPKLKPTPTPTPPEVLDADSVIRINSELVQLHVRVIDRNNKPIGNVAKGEFHVFEDGVPQTIETFTREEVPISYGLAVDTSASLRSQIQSVIDAGKTIVNSNKPGDKTFLVRFISSDKIQTEQDFTDNRDLLIDALDNLYVEGGQTAVIDAVYLSAEHVAEYKEGDEGDRRRRALIVITDGEDRSSFYKEPQLLARLREEDVQIYVIGFVNELDKDAGFIRKSPRDKAVNLINKLASETGGRAFFPESVSELPQIANEIVRDMRTQYVIAYNPTNKTQDGSYRAIKVTVDQPSDSEKRIALTRTGRLARKETGSSVRPPTVRMPSASTPVKKP